MFAAGYVHLLYTDSICYIMVFVTGECELYVRDQHQTLISSVYVVIAASSDHFYKGHINIYCTYSEL